MSKKSRTKGHSFEREVAILLRKVYPEAQRNLEYQENMAYGVDLVGTGHYRIQCKRLKRYPSINTIQEVKCDEDLGDIPVLVAKADRGRIMAVIPLEALIWLMEKEKRLEERKKR